MVGRLLTLPLRVGVRGTQLVLRTAENAAGRAAIGALQLVDVVRRRGSAAPDSGGHPPDAQQSPSSEPERVSAPPATSTADPRRAVDDAPATQSDRTAPVISAPQPEDGDPPIPPEPAHVSEEPELVREEAEPGAEDGAGATVTIRPPWQGYEHMGAREVIARLDEASPAELAAVQLYESSNRSRQTVLETVERRLKAANGRG
jgi:hypothetical protein